MYCTNVVLMRNRNTNVGINVGSTDSKEQLLIQLTNDTDYCAQYKSPRLRPGRALCAPESTLPCFAAARRGRQYTELSKDGHFGARHVVPAGDALETLDERCPELPVYPEKGLDGSPSIIVAQHRGHLPRHGHGIAQGLATSWTSVGYVVVVDTSRNCLGAAFQERSRWPAPPPLQQQ